MCSIIFSYITIIYVSISLAETLNQPFYIYEELLIFQAQSCCTQGGKNLEKVPTLLILRGDQTI